MIKCRAILSLGDDYGDNSCTFHCQLEQGHAGDHSEKFCTYKNVAITWDGLETKQLSKFKFEVVRQLVRYTPSPSQNIGEPVKITTGVMTEAECYIKCGQEAPSEDNHYWDILEVTPIEGTEVIETTYEDENYE